MNEDLQKALAEFVKSSLLTLQQGKDFVLTQAPDLIQQLVRWHFWNSVLGNVLDLVLIVGGYILLKKVLVPSFKKDSDPVWQFVAIIVAAALSLIAACSFIFADLPTLIQITVAPKVWLLEWALSQVKGA